MYEIGWFDAGQYSVRDTRFGTKAGRVDGGWAGLGRTACRWRCIYLAEALPLRPWSLVYRKSCEREEYDASQSVHFNYWVNLNVWCDLHISAVADPGFPRGGTSSKGGDTKLLFWPIFSENCTNIIKKVSLVPKWVIPLLYTMVRHSIRQRIRRRYSVVWHVI